MVNGTDGQGEAGRTLGAGGRYLIQGLLGEGGMASVHRAYDTVLDRNVAIKTMHSEFSREQSFRERFRREAQAVARLNHTNIVAVYDSGEEPSDEGAPVPYIVMEYVEGDPLRDVLNADIEQFGAMPADRALTITADVLAALAASHEMGLVHRDIKPGNVMVTRRGVVKVMDFGIARAVQSGVTSMTQTGMVVGTPQYLSPEQALGRAVDARSDLYTTGVMLFELLTGQLPFEGDSPLSIAYHHVQTPPPVPSGINRAIPPAVDALVNRALAKDPAHRFQSADEMIAEIRRINSPDTLGGTAPMVTGGAHPGVHPSQAASGQQYAFGPIQQGAPGGPQSGYSAPISEVYSGYGPPSQAGGPPTPNPYQQQPVGGAPSAPSGASRKRGPLIVVAAVVAAGAITGVSLMLANSGGGGGKPNPHTSSSHSAAAKSNDGLQGPVDPKGGYKASDFKDCDNTFPGQNNTVTVPNLSFNTVKWSTECAERPAVGLKVKTVESPSAVWRKGTVLSQKPDQNSQVKKGSTVTLTVSSGP
ncbi:hypothetical protein BIV57_07065 [Mangrovactinospora gilvigrisea]|uniref:non-specific serine/threonine protein kinase n=1 Tax=Mangrovactinospora gilvigrisea TaxID=1428644 RepID=A0A1J7BHY7_9ACTN|nr:protein kinase [Mangrovactinospora gilvigrisea]OIV38197.1 hypothetical protein BIV57_07065 [Mangrovactinospora gilvigrisea]